MAWMRGENGMPVPVVVSSLLSVSLSLLLPWGKLKHCSSRRFDRLPDAYTSDGDGTGALLEGRVRVLVNEFYARQQV
jgi:hypothetical protein